jgi:hypothetical protein
MGFNSTVEEAKINSDGEVAIEIHEEFYIPFSKEAKFYAEFMALKAKYTSV